MEHGRQLDLGVGCGERRLREFHKVLPLRQGAGCELCERTGTVLLHFRPAADIVWGQKPCTKSLSSGKQQLFY